MLGQIWNFVSFPVSLLLVLTIVVFIHELGHFLVARWCGVRVQAFSIGFGREIWGFTDRQGTRWKLAWIPLGGYVRFMDDENAASAPSRAALEKLSPADREGAFQNKPLRHRAMIVAAGPAFNIASAVLFLVAVFWAVGVDGRTTAIDAVRAGSPAEKAGLKGGDVVTEVNGRSVERWVELQRTINRNPNVPMELTVLRDGRPRRVGIVPAGQEIRSPSGATVELGDIGIVKFIPARIGMVQSNSPAARGGLQSGDLIVAIDGKPIGHFGDLQQIIGSNQGTPAEVTVERGADRLTLSVLPEALPDRPGRRIGISPKSDAERRYGLADSVRFATGEVVYYSEEILRGIPKLPAAIAKVFSFQKQDDIGGPIAIAEMSKHAVESGFAGFLGWIALFSVMLGIMNLLPIPLLDGGHLVFYAIEAIRGRPLDERKQELSFKIGMAVLGTLMFAAIFGDIMRKLL